MQPEHDREKTEYPPQLLEGWTSATDYQRELMIEISRAHARGWLEKKHMLIQRLMVTVSAPTAYL